MARTLPLLLVGALVGWAVGRWGAPQLLAALSASSLTRTNYRKRVLVAGLGLLLPLGLLAWVAVLAVAGRVAPLRAEQLGVATGHATLAVVVAGLAFAFLGLIDDLAEDGPIRGFRGHLGALAAGRLTGGGAKLLGGGLAGVTVATLAVERPRWVIVPAALLVASAANVANLFDLRPGRCAKVFLPLWVLAAALAPGPAAWSAGLAGATLGTLPTELREEGMLGDAGANALGATVGALLATGPWWLVVGAAAALLGLQLASERVSFTRVIDGNRWLRRVDRLGRLPD
jgi:UDP-N-acetylmuramyl pentapeptide phosphotransferase/UDP-N-acetylglucosamine-1-phosphate transferase